MPRGDDRGPDPGEVQPRRVPPLAGRRRREVRGEETSEAERASGASTAKYSGDGALSVVCVRPYTKSAFARVPSASATRPGRSPVSN